MTLSPDEIIYWEWGFVQINATLVFSVLVMSGMCIGSFLITRGLTSGLTLSRWQNMLEAVVVLLQTQIREASNDEPGRYLPFIGTLFLYIAFANVLEAVPGFEPPTASLSTAAALATCVFIAVPVYGIASTGFRRYMKHYLEPTPFMLPFNVIGELSRTFSLAIRLFGNMLSGSLIVAVMLSLAPLLFPIAMQAFGILIGLIQAYVFAILALVYIASATRAHEETDSHTQTV
jgi:F-type H+-transporting ATPase subunit a